MEYFLLKESKDVINPIKILGLDPKRYVPAMTHTDFRAIEKVSVAYIQYEHQQEIPDILAHPTYMVSDELRKILHMYDENISFKAVQVFPDQKKYVKEAAKTYWIYDCVMENCLHPDTVILPNGTMEQIILDKRKIRGRDIFRLQRTLENKIVVSLAVVESILRRNLYGIGIEKLSMR